MHRTSSLRLTSTLSRYISYSTTLRSNAHQPDHHHVAAAADHLDEAPPRARPAKWTLDDDIAKRVTLGEAFNLRHAGRFALGSYRLSDELEQAIYKAILKFDPRSLRPASLELAHYIRNREPMIDGKVLKAKKERLAQKSLQRQNAQELDVQSQEELGALATRVQSDVARDVKKETFNWKALNYNDEYTCVKYLVGRINEEYAAVTRVLLEIKQRDPSFTPTSLFDFGFGVGSVIWAAHGVWPHVIKSTYGVDASAAMTNLATNILYAGDSVENAPALSGVTFRRTLTGSRLRQCDLVTSAFSLMDQWSKKDRINTLASLWRKTLDYLVIVEPGSKFGYGLIMEAREFFADRGRSSVLKNNLGDTFDDGTPEIFAPCPHAEPCPKMPDGVFSGAVCNFSASFQPIGFLGKMYDRTPTSIFSYLIVRKRRPLDTDAPDSDTGHPPLRGARVVGPVLQKSKSSICRLCCVDGQLRQLTSSKSRDDLAVYNVVRKAKWGDLLPIKVKEAVDDKRASDDGIGTSPLADTP